MPGGWVHHCRMKDGPKVGLLSSRVVLHKEQCLVRCHVWKIVPPLLRIVDDTHGHCLHVHLYVACVLPVVVDNVLWMHRAHVTASQWRGLDIVDHVDGPPHLHNPEMALLTAILGLPLHLQSVADVGMYPQPVGATATIW
eukprot:CAMPEP_0180780478 /NCGR_PEP_ID=MMETSP1038_2-20121128/47031_1 /TAXON_ID=632150 /ORGANISM="Azadinium spinosum, Strain 3D9" /LENGTH=139 /DNA_ID=CAMNT_0022816021 /DNA_START=152 /DNA_END=568 /DNA_ORIENTATION=+